MPLAPLGYSTVLNTTFGKLLKTISIGRPTKNVLLSVSIYVIHIINSQPCKKLRLSLKFVHRVACFGFFRKLACGFYNFLQKY